ncbi:50S ribosomal protein L22 [Patescibacteria group bacterium]|jgi:large subunit ribosomal protein L22|nr:50S ribosomal protein L22 [Patescibacteria group bacterium]
MMEVKAKLNNLRVSAKKARLVAGAIRGLSASEALFRLPVIFKKSSPVVEKLLKSAVANASDQYDLQASDLLIKSIVVNKGMDLKRWIPAAFGRAHPFRKHSCHIEIVLTAKEGVKVNKKIKDNKVETVKLADLDKEAKKDAKDTEEKENKTSKKADKEKLTKEKDTNKK